ncbi:hypothetical protein BDZ91DRAFT_738849, partial [Kalaharituber pfeilii]
MPIRPHLHHFYPYSPKHPSSVIPNHYRFLSTPPNSTPPDPFHHRIPSRLLPYLTPYLNHFRNAPLTHVTTFLLLHELTAVVPLAGIWWGLHSLRIPLPALLPSTI